MSSENTDEQQDVLTQMIIDFLKSIGLEVHDVSLEGETVLPGIRIDSGMILVDEEKLTYPCDLLHEAGHLAVSPAELRNTMSDNNVASDQPADVSEVFAIAWSYAATLHRGIDPRLLFHEGGYHGQSQSLLMNFSLGVYMGVNGLESSGMTATGDRAIAKGVLPYPEMLQWIRC